MNALKLCLSGTALSMLVGCATWDYTQTPQQQAYNTALIQQSAYDQQLRNQQAYQNSQALLNQYQANVAAQQQLQQYNQLQGQLNHIQRSIKNQNRAAAYAYTPPSWQYRPSYRPGWR